MHCTSCVMLIEGDLEGCQGVHSAECNYAKGECVVKIDDEMNNDEINKIINNDGYSVLSLEVI